MSMAVLAQMRPFGQVHIAEYGHYYKAWRTYCHRTVGTPQLLSDHDPLVRPDANPICMNCMRWLQFTRSRLDLDIDAVRSLADSQWGKTA